MRTSLSAILVTAFLCASPGIAPQGAETQGKTLRGWLSDEVCARGRAAGGVYTGTNPDCAKQCVAKGKKIVLILRDEKQVLNITNQEIAKANIGDYVEVTGTIEEQTKTVHIDSLKMITQGRAMCDVPRPKK